MCNEECCDKCTEVTTVVEEVMSGANAETPHFGNDDAPRPFFLTQLQELFSIKYAKDGPSITNLGSSSCHVNCIQEYFSCLYEIW